MCRKRKEIADLSSTFSDDYFPFVTIQLPIYNEKYVVNRLIEAIAQINYPLNRIEVQLLDDSTDETTSLITEKIKEYPHIPFIHIRRQARAGYKAGALQEGLAAARGEFIAIFDADFIPGKDFLLKTINQFRNNKIGMVQTRWGHLNNRYNLLTNIQRFGLDIHFTIEQTGRNRGNYFINFNGTAGVWRKSCIVDAGGWKADTLTEDLDLSYRAQLKGWEFIYLEDVVSPAELPPVMSAYRAQQYRWTKGAAQNTRKHLMNVMKAKLPFARKWHAVLHLLNGTMFIFGFISSFLSVPAIIIKNTQATYMLFFQMTSIFILNFLLLTLLYFIPSYFYSGSLKKAILDFIKTFPVFITFNLGLSLHNALAALEGLLNRKSPFIRTPKFNLTAKESLSEKEPYLLRSFSWLNFFEGLMVIYFIAGIGIGLYFKDYSLLPLHIVLVTGFGLVFYSTFKEIIYRYVR